jgi:hypothetical protein
VKKLTLNLDELQVEGFPTATREALSEFRAPGEELDAATLACTGKRSCGHICP